MNTQVRRRRRAIAIGLLGALSGILLPLVARAQVPSSQDGRGRLQNRYNGAVNKPAQQMKLDEAVRKFNDEDLPTRLEGVAAMATVEERSKAIGYLLQACNDPNGSVRMKAIDTLGNMKAKEAITPLVQQLFMRDTDETTKQRILVTLGKIGDKRATQPVIDFLARENTPALEGNAIFALGEIGDPDALKPLEAIVKADGQPALSSLAQAAIRKINEKPAPDVVPPALAADRRRGEQPPEEEPGLP